MSLNKAHEGYIYQDLLTSYFILKEILIGNINSKFIIDKKNTPQGIPDSFDDLVIMNGKTIQRKQIKYSNDNTNKKLEKSDLANTSNYNVALFELYQAWKKLYTPNSEFRLCLAWDEPIEDNIKKVLEPYNIESSFEKFKTKLYRINLDNLWKENPENFSRWDSLKRFVKDNSIDRNDFKKFCDSLVIELKLPKASLDANNPGDLEKIVLNQIEKLGIGQYPNDDIYINDFLERLAKKVGEYRAKSSTITAKEILQDLRVKTDFGQIEQKFEIDQSKNIKSDDKYNILYNELVLNKKTILIGEPGSGKSWFLTNFIEYLKTKSIKVIRHYCFTDTEDEFIEKRVSSDVFFGNLIADIITIYSKLQNKKERLFVSSLEELNLLLSHIDEELIIIIDGLDHIDRVLKNSSTLSKDKTKIIEYISNIKTPKNIHIVLSSQPVLEVQTLINDFEYIEYQLPKWDIDDILKLMDKYSLDDLKLENKLLSEYLQVKSEGNPLYLTYLIKTLINEEITFDLINNLPQYDFNLKRYYDYLTSQMENTLTSEILSCLDFSITVNELSKINPQNHHIKSDLKILSPVLKENISRGGMKLYHDSFRRYNIEKLEENNGLENIYKLITKWLSKKGFYKNDKAYRYLLNYYIKLDKFEKVKKYATNNFLTKSLYNGYSEKTIKINYDNFLYVAKETQDWELFIYISELNRTINATLSDDLTNEFEESFELYFEAIGLIYGFKRANEILFFEGKKNFSDELIAKAFYISQRNGYTPNWEKIESYFKGNIPIEKFKYFIAYVISNNKLYKNFNELKNVLFKNYDYLKILIEELYYLEGFEKVLFLYEKFLDEYKNMIAKKINNILDDTTCNQRILVKYQKQHLCLPKLCLKNIDYANLVDFYKLIQQYSQYDLFTLKTFEQDIKSDNFYYNFLKFIIRNFIIEAEILRDNFKNYTEVEDAFVENFKFLASDIDQFKGEPRAIDFITFNEHIIDKSIEQGLKYIKSKQAWAEVVDCLDLIPCSSILRLERKYINKNNVKSILNLYKKYDKSSDDYYSWYLDYKLKKSIYNAKIKNYKKAKKNLSKAMRLVTSYTPRKDTTLTEIQNPLSSINSINNKLALDYIKKLLPLNLAVQSHSEDGKSIRWLYINWFDEFLEIDKQKATIFLIDRFLKEEWFWKYEYMFINYIKFSKDINPLIANFLYKLSPTINKDDYVNSFADIIFKIKDINMYLAKQSLINLLERDLNNSSEKLSNKTIKKLQVLKNILNISIPIKKLEKEPHKVFQKEILETELTKKFGIYKLLKDKSVEEINKYFEKIDRELDSKDLNLLLFYFSEKKDEELIKKILIPIITKRFVGIEDYYEKLREFVNYLKCSNELKTYLLVKIFVFSQGGWLENFVNKKALKDAVSLDKNLALNYLSIELENKFKTIFYYPQSTANLIIAFEFAGLKKKDILAMYKRGFEVIEYRLPDTKKVDWKNIEDTNLKDMSSDELAIVMILVRFKNYDTAIQKEIIYALNYFLNYDESILIKPLKWFFEYINYFPHVSIASLFELFLVYVDNKQVFFQSIKDDIIKVKNLQNLYILNSIEELLEKIENV